MSAPVAIPIVKFNAGEVSPSVRARSDLDWNSAACEIMLNAIAQPQGPAAMRPGTWHPGSPRVPGGGTAGTVRMIGFIASVDPLEAYTIEATDQKFRFWYAGSRQKVGAPYELSTPYLAADLAAIRTVQSRDVMWLLHPKYQPRKLKRLTVDTFQLDPVEFVDGPYYPQNTGTTTVSIAGTTGSQAMTASAPLWLASDVGRFWRTGDGSGNWGYGVITAFTDSTHVTLDIKTTLPSLSPGTVWRAGLWSDRTGWPSCGVFHQERLFYGSNPASSFARADGSASGDFDKFTPGTTDDDAVAYLLASDELPVVRDLISSRALVALMSSAELKIGNERATEAFTPGNTPQVIDISGEGSMNAPALKLKRGMIFLQRYARSVHEIAYSVDADALQTRDVSIRGEHIGDRSPFAGMAWQNRPNNLLWLWSQNGSLAGMTYTPEQSVIAMHRHRLGGRYRGGWVQIESMCRVPGTASDEIWACVRRTIGGVDVRHLAVFADALHANEPPDEAIYLDAAVRVRGTAPAADIAFSELTDTTVKITASAAVFSAPDVGRKIFAVLEDLDEEAEDGQPLWRRVALEISSYQSGTVVVASRIANWLPASLAIASGSWRYGITEITGLDHLEGERVGILADGAELAPQVVTGGKVVLADEVGTGTAGLLYTMILQPVPMDAGARQGTARTRPQGDFALGLEVVRSGRFRAGVPGNLFEANIRTADHLMDEAVPLKTGVHVMELPAGSDERRTRWRVVAEGPLPVTIACAVPHQRIGEAIA